MRFCSSCCPDSVNQKHWWSDKPGNAENCISFSCFFPDCRRVLQLCWHVMFWWLNYYVQWFSKILHFIDRQLQTVDYACANWYHRNGHIHRAACESQAAQIMVERSNEWVPMAFLQVSTASYCWCCPTSSIMNAHDAWRCILQDHGKLL